MKRKLLSMAFLITSMMVTNAQAPAGTTLGSVPKITDAFFDKVNYIGAFGTSDWTTTWANYNCQQTPYGAINGTATWPVGKVFSDGYTTKVVSLKDTTLYHDWVTLSGDLTTQTLDKAKTYYIKGFTYVPSGVTLTIPAGTVLRGQKSSMGALIVERGGKIIAQGTAAEPIVFTSEFNPGVRTRGDWGGLVICGKAMMNQGETQVEGGPRTKYGPLDAGSVIQDDHDNSGIYQYIRIEFAGYPLQPNKEINGITFCAVGDGTVIDHLMVSYSNDDSYEWFGGTVNCKYLIAYHGFDDEFDTDFGYAGRVQFAVGLRDSSVADISGSNGFESDNDANGSDFLQKTSAVFSNFSLFGPCATTNNGYNPLFKRSEHVRRNSALNVYNTIYAGWPTGLYMDGAKTMGNAWKATPDLHMEHNTLAQMRSKYFEADVAARIDSARKSFMKAGNDNDTVTSLSSLMINDPFNYASPSFTLKATSPLLIRSYWFASAVTSVTVSPKPLSILFPGTGTLTAVVAPVSASEKGIIWSSKNTSIATVSETGVVTGVSLGTTTIYAKSLDGNKMDSATVVITNIAVPVTGLSLDKSTMSVTAGKTASLVATVTPTGATNNNVTWTSLDFTIAAVSSTGMVAGVAPGTTMIIATSVDGSFKDTCEVTVLVNALKDVVTDGQINVYPNPFVGQTTIEFNMIQSEYVCINIYDLTGALVKSYVNTQVSEGRFAQEVELSAGMYFAKISVGKESKVVKLIAQ